jgi:hypothetical protein
LKALYHNTEPFATHKPAFLRKETKDFETEDRRRKSIFFIWLGIAAPVRPWNILFHVPASE